MSGPQLRRKGYDAALQAFVDGCARASGLAMRASSGTGRFDTVCTVRPFGAGGYLHIFAAVDRVTGDVFPVRSPRAGGVLHNKLAGNLFDSAGGLARITPLGPTQ